MRALRLLTFASTFGVALVTSSRASAFNTETHRRIVEAAASAMDFKDDAKPPLPHKGIPITPAQWEAFLARLKPARDKLNRLHTGLPPATRNSGSTNDPSLCEYKTKFPGGRDLNLLRTDLIRIEEMPYRYEPGSTACNYVSPVDPPVTPLGSILGYHASSVDALNNDQVLWYRPTGTIFLGGLGQTLAARYGGLLLGALMVPIVCVGNIIAKLDFGACDANDAFDLANKINPLEYIFGIFPGVGSFTNEDFNGFFHFVTPTVGTYNDHRGLMYEHAGPDYPGALDVTIMIAADISGLTINPYESDGVKNYGKYDRIERTVVQWNAHAIGHTEFSPASNLARYGWDEFDGLDAKNLAFPLHAIGDAAAPHHVTGTTGWGHRPFEDAVDELRTQFLPRSDKEGLGGFGAMQDEVLVIAYQALADFDNDPSIQNFVNREAVGTRQIATDHGDWVFQDLKSLEYFTDKSGSIANYRRDADQLRPFVNQAVGQTIAFLVKAGERTTGYPTADEASRCQSSEHYTGLGSGCASGPAPAPTVGFLPAGVVQTSCGNDGATCASASDCCTPLTCSGGHCSPPAPTCGDSGINCAADRDCCPPLVCSVPSGAAIGTCATATTPVDCGLNKPCTDVTQCGPLEECRAKCCRSTVH